MKGLSILIIIALIHFNTKSINPDSICYKLQKRSISQQLKLLDSLSFNDIISNCQKINPILLKYERVAREHQQFNSLAKIYVNLSLSYYYLGKYDENLKYGLKAVRLYDSLCNRNELGTMYGELGYQMKYRDLNKSTELMRHGIRILEKVANLGSLSKIYNNYGVLKEIANQLDSANYFYSKSLSIKMNLRDSVGIPYSLNNISMVYILKHQYDSALYFLNKSTKIRQTQNDDVGLCENYSYYGQIYLALGELDKAIEYFLSGLKLARKHHFTSLTKDLYKDLSNVYERKKDYERALKYHQLYKLYADSLVNLETNKAIADLQVKFETSEKEKALIEKTTQLRQQNVIKISIIISSIIFLLSILIFYWNKILLIRRNEKIKVQNALIEGEQAERNRLALELHDSVANDLNGVILLLNGSKEQNNLVNDAGLNRSLEKLNETHQKVRKLSHTLMPRSLTERGLKFAINDLASDFGSGNLHIDLQLLGIDERLKSFVEFNVFCIIQEALNNIIKHSNASNVLIECNRVEDLLFVNIEDNGVGFDVKHISEKRGIGMDNITNRVKLINGTLAINSMVGKGTIIEIQIPLK